MNGNGCAGSIGERRQHRKDVAAGSSPRARRSRLRSAPRPSTRTMPSSSRSSLQLAPAPLLVAGELRDRDADPGELLGRGQPVLRRASRRPSAPGRRRPATRTMKNSSRLLAEIDRKRSCSSSGWLRFCRLLEHAAVELQPGQLAVDEALRRLPQGRALACRLCDRLGRALDGRLLERLDVRFQRRCPAHHFGLLFARPLCPGIL